MSKYLHIVTFDVPFPPNYGGVIDVYNKIKSLSELGVKIILHCFRYGRDESSELDKLCYRVNYYKRNIFKNPFAGSIPYIIATRLNQEVLTQLLQDQYPILFEGLHTCGYLDHPELEKRTKLVRMHNVEHEYYSALAKVENSFIKRRFFQTEAIRLKEFEKILKHSNHILSISPADNQYFKSRGFSSIYIPAFHGNTKIPAEKRLIDDYVLYHGNLGVGENNQAACFIAESVWGKEYHVPLIIAGNDASQRLRSLCKKNSYITLISPTQSEYINKLIRDARVNLLITFQNTGIKLKLINALFSGSLVCCNSPMIENTGLESLCKIADSPDEIRNTINSLMSKDLNIDEIQLIQRETIMFSQFDNIKNGIRILELF